MSNKEVAGTLDIARKLVGHLPKALEDELRDLIQRAEDEQDPIVEIEIIDLLSPHEIFRQAMREQLDLQNGQTDTTKGEYAPFSGAPTSIGYSSLAGWPDSIPASKKWVCQEPTCNQWIIVIQEGEDPPICKIHETNMVHKRKERG